MTCIAVVMTGSGVVVAADRLVTGEGKPVTKGKLFIFGQRFIVASYGTGPINTPELMDDAKNKISTDSCTTESFARSVAEPFARLRGPKNEPVDMHFVVVGREDGAFKFYDVHITASVQVSLVPEDLGWWLRSRPVQPPPRSPDEFRGMPISAARRHAVELVRRCAGPEVGEDVDTAVIDGTGVSFKGFPRGTDP